jgi:hypothetical protein
MFVPVTALYLAPMWLFKYFPSQDGPSHLDNAFMLAHYHDPQNVFSRIASESSSTRRARRSKTMCSVCGR